MRTVRTCYFIPLAVLTLLTALLGCGGGGGGGTPGSDGAAYSIGGLVSGLSGTGLVLQNNSGDDLGIASSGTFTFAAKLADGAGYHVTVKTHPTALTQTCTVSGGTGTIAGANVSSLLVNCSTETYSVGGTVSGLTGSGLTLLNNGGDSLAVSAGSTTFAFGTRIADGALYSVTVGTQPGSPAQNCVVSSGSGTVAAANITNVAVDCTVTPDCTADPVCGAPSGTGGDEICVSGRIVDGADHSQGIISAVTGSIEVRIYEPLNFLSDPTSPPFKRLTTANGFLDSCGRFTTRFSVAGDAVNGLIAITAADLAGTMTPNYILGTSQYRVMANTNITGARTFLVSKTQDQAWATDAGLSSGTFASTGTIAVRYHQGSTVSNGIPGVPAQGVVPQWGGVTNAATDFFFSDSALTTLQTFSASQNDTGNNGTAFLRLGAGVGSAGAAGTSCIKSGGGTGTWTVIGPTFTGTTAGAIVFFNLEVSCI